MQSNSGGILAHIEPKFDIRDLMVNYSGILSELEAGRMLGIYWQVPRIDRVDSWNPEMQITTEFLMSPADRDSNEEWLFSANGACRAYNSDQVLEKTYLWVLLRKSGPKAYKRIQLVPEEVLHTSKLPVSDPAFTRDVANNVWHLKSSDFETHFTARMRSLTTWADETFVHLGRSGIREIESLQLDLSQGLIPRAVKMDYSF